MADKKKSLKVTADKKKSLKVSSPMVHKKKNHTKKSLIAVQQISLEAMAVEALAMADKKKSHTKKGLIAKQKKSLKPVEAIAPIVSSPMAADREKNRKPNSHLFLSPMADIDKNLKPDVDIVSILTTHKDVYQSNNNNREANPGCVLRPFDVVTKEPAPGLLAGRLVFKQGKFTVDCSKWSSGGALIPYMVQDKIQIISSDALFILVVENTSAFKLLVLKRFYDQFPCIIITSEKASPDMGTRMFLKLLYTELNLPVLALVDSTAQGLRSLYSYNLHISDIKWLGMRPSDLNKHGMPESQRLRMKRKDIKIVEGLLKNKSVMKNQGWVDEFNSMLSTKQMAVIEAFSVFDFFYLWKVYLPLMLQEQDWL